MAFEMASTNLVLKLSIIKRRHQLRRRVSFILADLIVPPILSIYRAALRISDGANSRREQQRLYQPPENLTPWGFPTSRKCDSMQHVVDSRSGQHVSNRD